MNERQIPIPESLLRDTRANLYIASNGIRRQRTTIKTLSYGFYLQSVLGLILGGIALYSWNQYETASSRLEATQQQLRHEAGQAASFRDWYEKTCHPNGGETRPECVGVDGTN